MVFLEEKNNRLIDANCKRAILISFTYIFRFCALE